VEIHNSAQSFDPKKMLLRFFLFWQNKIYDHGKTDWKKRTREKVHFPICTVRWKDKKVVKRSRVPTKMCQVVKVESI